LLRYVLSKDVYLFFIEKSSINQMKLIGEYIKENCRQNKKMLAWLIDPDKKPPIDLENEIAHAKDSGIDFIFLGGSLLMNDQIEEYLTFIKSTTDLPVILFPSGPNQVHHKADGILFLSLISGRNPDFLIGRHVEVASILKETDIEVLPTGYILIESGTQTTVSYISNTLPIPANKPEIAVNTALAGEMLGLQYIFLDGGSGAKNKVSEKTIKAVREKIDSPLIVGGGIRTPEQMKDAFDGGADIVVVGNVFEENPKLIAEFGKVSKSL
jgi:phosphoglycerol geranylgeranyltransferase